MPTGNEYTKVTFGQSEQSYVTTERDSRDGNIDPRIGEMLPEVGAGNYPRTFDREIGSYPGDSPQCYPDQVFSHIPAQGPDTSYTTSRTQGGEYGVTRGQREGGRLGGTDQLPASIPSKQFSSDVNGEPKALLNDVRPGIDIHAEINYSQGLCQPVATMGSHPWLRDELTNTGQKEAGNESPHYTAQIARRILEKQGED